MRPSITRDRIGSIKWSPIATPWRLLALLVMAATVTMTLPAYSQVLYGSLRGNVTDQTGAVVPAGAKVQALNVNTNGSRSTTTDSRGAYAFSDLQPGIYDWLPL